MNRPLQYDWTALDSSADSARSRRLAEPGAAAAFLALGEAPHRHILALSPSWPTGEETADRFNALVRLKERIDLAGRHAH